MKCENCDAINTDAFEGMCAKCWRERAKVAGKEAHAATVLLLMTLVVLSFFGLLQILTWSSCKDMAVSADKVDSTLLHLEASVVRQPTLEEVKTIFANENPWRKPLTISDEEINVCKYKGLMPEIAERAKKQGDHEPSKVSEVDLDLIYQAHEVKRKRIKWSYHYPLPAEEQP